MDRSPLVFASIVSPLIAFAGRLGLETEPILASMGVRSTELQHPDAMVPYAALPQIWEALVQRFPGRPLGLEYSRTIPVSALGVVGYAIMRAENLGQALDLYIRFCRLIDPFMTIHLERLGEVCRFSIVHEPSVEQLAEPLEMMTAAFYRVARELNPGAGPPLELCFRHPQRHDAQTYRAHFAGSLPTFEAGYTGAAFEVGVLALPIAAADSRLSAYLERYASVLMDNLRAPPVEDAFDVQVRAVVDRLLLHGGADPASVAKALRTSVRSLQRSLHALGTSFSAQLDIVRRTRALAMLAGRRSSIAEIAFALGYTDPRAFYRAFRRWTGSTPAEYRGS